jgi:hypothetical protein
MIVLNFYFSEQEKWIEYELNGSVIREEFVSESELRNFIEVNNLPLTYKGCTDC